MIIQTEKCPYCEKELESDSEKLYWHLKICELKNTIIIQPNPPTPLTK